MVPTTKKHMVQSSNQNRHLDIFQGTSTHRERGNHQKSIWKSQHLRHLRATHSCDFPSSRFYFSLYLLQIAIVVPPFWLLYCMSGFDRPFWIYQNWNEFKFVYHSPFFFFDFFVSSGKLWKNISRTSTLDLSFEYMLSTYNIGSKLENCSMAVSLIPKSCDSLGHKHHQHIPCHKSLVFSCGGEGAVIPLTPQLQTSSAPWYLAFASLGVLETPKQTLTKPR